jgi:hypothetical protein
LGEILEALELVVGRKAVFREWNSAPPGGQQGRGAVKEREATDA